MNYVSLWRNLYCMISGVYVLLIFIRAFLPMTVKVESFSTYNDIPSSVGDVKINVNDVYQSHVDRVIIMVIDALRVDFVDSLQSEINMPYVSSMLKKNEAFIVVGNVQTPTVTMPRLKAMTTGTVPSFIDIVYNLGSHSIEDDNIIQQAESNGKSAVFYGDETWLKLFPSSFKRKEGTTSFFVSDFTEVDNNVTRHLDYELKASDWDLMILHYLGLDHIGHLEGPKSAYVKPKLLEMDHIVQKIHHNMIEWAEKMSLRPMLIICGDHGMKDSGGHGGATTAETTVPFIMLDVRHQFTMLSEFESVSQIDLVPTLSVLMGLPIPKCNIGKLIPQFIQTFPMKNKLFAYYYNARQVLDHFKEINSYDSSEAYLKYEEAIRLHELWLKSNYQIAHDAMKSEELYLSSLENMSEILGNTRVTQDMFCLLIAICIELQICGILLFHDTNIKCSTLWNFHILIFTFLVSFSNIVYCLSSEAESAVCTLNINNVVGVTIPIVVLFSLNISIIVSSCSTSLFLQTPTNQALRLFLIGSGLHLVSLLSSSFIEEEHQVWYFGWLTFLMAVLGNQCQRSYLCGGFKNILIFLSLNFSIFHRILRKLNQTGDKWASLPDISDWLHEPHNKGLISLVLFLGLFGNGVFLGYCHWIHSHHSKFFRAFHIILCFLSLFIVYLYRAATGAVLKLFDTIDSKGITEANFFWFFLLLMTLQEFSLFLSRQEKLKIHFIETLMKWCLFSWMLVISLLHRPHNVLLPGVQAFASIFLNILYQQTFKTKYDTRWLSIAHCWLGMVFYFYQGNSNSLSTIDVASGYVGLKGYNPIVVGIFLLVNTFSAPVFSLLLLVCQLVLEAKNRGIHWFLDHIEAAFHTVISYRLCTVTLYLVLLAFQRHHLFVWTVFSPKLFYESVFTLVQFVLIFLLYITFYSIYVLLPPFKTNKAYE